MSIKTAEELDGMRRVGAVVRRVIDAMTERAADGITTGELDDIGARVVRQHGARSAPSLVYGFPGANCISLNDEAVHGIPGEGAGFTAFSRIHLRAAPSRCSCRSPGCAR
jgi:methionyl aminopeptidase